MTGDAGGVRSLFGSLGRAALRSRLAVVAFLQHASGVGHLLGRALVSSSGFFSRRVKLREQLFLMMRNVGVQSFPIVCLVSFLLGAILVLQSGETLSKFGQLQVVPGAVGWSLTREISPLMAAIILTARVGGSFTAVLASMKINDEILALETMAIRPIGYLVTPRLLSMMIMLPCLTLFSVVIGMLGSAIVANVVYGLSFALYLEKTAFYITMTDLLGGLAKSGVFAVLISSICCYFGLITQGGSVGLGRNIMVAVVSSIVAVILADTMVTAFITNYVQ